MQLREYLRGFRRSWVQHTGMQLATLSVLAATFTVVVFVMSISLNLKTLLSHWGDSVQMSIYLEDTITPQERESVERLLSGDARVRTVEYVGKEQATSAFRQKMTTYAPDLLDDSEFANPFPASFQVTLAQGVSGEALAMTLQSIAERLGSLKGVEDVSYGQSWVRNYSAFVAALSASGWGVVVIMVVGSIFVIGNAIRASIAARRDEIEILELVGATSRMIRAPFVFEGALMGLVAAALALIANFGFHIWEGKILRSSLAFARMATSLSFFNVATCVGLVLAGAALGAAGAYLTVRRINDGWSASQRGA